MRDETTIVLINEKTANLCPYIFDRFTEDDIKALFYDGSVTCWQDFESAALLDGIYMWMIWSGTDCIGICYSMDHGPASCTFHYGVFPEYRGRYALRVLKEMLELLPLTLPEIYLDITLIGITPSCNPQAIRMANLCGFKTVGKIPHILYDAYQDKAMDGVITYFRGE
ncbi:MAG: hypothetical protein DRP45_00910 [Candidatus Zixiibacteriota bacterium]|nr:MAG: hypothetical protein DRP45_00910 [candidate division Zixibacteria bacterium]